MTAGRARLTVRKRNVYRIVPMKGFGAAMESIEVRNYSETTKA